MNLVLRRSRCRIWLHFIYWFLVPFGWIISAFTLRSLVPPLIWLLCTSLIFITAPNVSKMPDVSPEKIQQMAEINYFFWQFVKSSLGSAYSAFIILKARKQINPN